MNWPLPQDFNEAIQNPGLAFSDPVLKWGTPVPGPLGLPLPRSGNFADVYQIRGSDGRDWALKCFTRPVFGLETRYARVAEALEKANLPFGVGFKFLAEGIRVRGEWRPAVKMEWVEGFVLNQFVRENVNRPVTLAGLLQMWVKLCRRLRELGIAHADIQHGNVLLVPATKAGAVSLKLIDYDGMYVPALANRPSGEAGHPNFQHPTRLATRAYSPDLDRFPHLVVATALKALEVCGPGLWEKYDNGDNLLFVEDDFVNPAGSKLMRSLWESGHQDVLALVGRLAEACLRPIPQTEWLDLVAPDGQPLELDPETRLRASEILGGPPPVIIPAVELDIAPTRAPGPPAEVEPSGQTGLSSEPVPTRPPARKSGTRMLDPVDDEDDERDFPSRRRPRQARRKRANPVLLVVLGGVVLAGAVFGGVVISVGKRPRQKAEVTANPEVAASRKVATRVTEPASPVKETPQSPPEDPQVQPEPLIPKTPMPPAEPTPAQGQPEDVPNAEPIWPFLKQAVRNRTYVASRLCGGGSPQLEFVDLLPEGGVLIGFYENLTERGLIAFDYFQPIYLTEKGEVRGRAYGIGRAASSRLVKAEKGQAIQGLTLRGGLAMDAFSVTYAPFDETGWQPGMTTTTPRVGGLGGSEHRFGFDGSVIVGMYGRLLGDGRVGGVGVLTVPLRLAGVNRRPSGPSPGKGDGAGEGSLGWSHVDLQNAGLVGDIVRIQFGQSILTREKFTGPVELTVVARTAALNIRLIGPGASMVIFNWEGNPKELRVHKPHTASGIPIGTAPVTPLSPNTWYTLRYRVTETQLDVWVDDQLIYSEPWRSDLTRPTALGVRGNGSVVEVKSLTVKSLKPPD